MISKEVQIPHVFEGIAYNGIDDFIAYYVSQSTFIDNLLDSYGAIKFRNVPIASQEEFQSLVNSLSEEFLAYIDGNSPRTKLSDNVYTSTEYDSSKKITMHNELSYSQYWPGKLFFTCLKVAETEGETLLADSREILRRMDKVIVDQVEEKGILYIRNLHAGLGMGPSWQDTFETSDHKVVEGHCRKLGIHYEWGSEQKLHLEHKRDGIIKTRRTSEKSWFNQIDQFHPVHLGAEYYGMIKELFQNPMEYPMYAMFGDKTPMPESMVLEITSVIDSVTVAPAWDTQELLLVDNEMVSHGRNPFTGERKVLVSMSK